MSYFFYVIKSQFHYVKHACIFFIIFCFFDFLLCQTFNVKPYLQNIDPTSVHIMWETHSQDESTLKWGQNLDLEFELDADVNHHTNNYYIHHAHIIDLTPGTKYFYKCITGSLESEIFDFVTPATSESESSLTLIAMSDMQKDWNNYNKFQEIINQGIINYFVENNFSELSDELDLIMIPGDLVDNGLNHNEWSEHFFGPSEPLFSYVPIYPVLGNHENNSSYFFSYFNLPDNGTNGYEEHWWWTDFSNVRIIGLNSNWDYQLSIQLDWLQDVLEETCADSNIDFVFAQLHHPHKSELWTPGETSFTGDVVNLLEQFTTNCGKPSIHFFGHTHGYSRGQSINHTHAMVNVATAGGAIDYWGEYPQQDYAEFSVTQDEWGFVIVNVEAGTNPQFTLKRISRGDDFISMDNIITDEFTIRMNNVMPDRPSVIYPIDIEISPDSVWLWANPFSDVDNDMHGFSQWQVSTNCNDFTLPIIDIFESHENWYYNNNLQENNSLINEQIIGLEGETDYCWRVRYRDKGLKWSQWSPHALFTTGESLYSPNLLLNPGAEDGISGWTIQEGVFESLEATECNGISPYSGQYYFCVGGLCIESQYAEVSQIIDVSEYSDCIDDSLASVQFGGFLSNWSGWDQPEMYIEFLDVNGSVLDTSATQSTLNNYWTSFDTLFSIPVLTHEIKFVLMGTRNGGQDNDSYFDNLFLRVLKDINCEYSTSTLNDKINFAEQFQLKENYPNPFNLSTNIVYYLNENSYIEIIIYDINGIKIKRLISDNQNSGSYSIKWDGINYLGNPVSSGVYFYTMIAKNFRESKKMILMK